MPCLKMKTVVEKILKAHKMLEAFQNAGVPGGEFHMKVENGGYMPFVVERHGNFVTVAHYYEQNGDLCPDPDVEFFIGADGEWYAAGITQVFGYTRVLVFTDGKLTGKYPRAEKEVTSFTNMWAKNLSVQGFADKACKVSSLTQKEAA